MTGRCRTSRLTGSRVETLPEEVVLAGDPDGEKNFLIATRVELRLSVRLVPGPLAFAGGTVAGHMQYADANDRDGASKECKPQHASVECHGSA